MPMDRRISSSGILEFKFLRDSVFGQSESSDGEVDKKYNGRTILEVGRDAVARDSVAEQRNKVPHHSRTPADSQARS